MLAVAALSAGCAIVLWLRRHRPERPLALQLIAGCLLLTSISETGWAIDQAFGAETLAAIANITHLISNALVLAGAIQLMRMRIVKGDRAGLIDSGIVMLATFGVSWDLLTVPALNSDTGATRQLLIVPAPFVAALVVGVVIRIVLTGAMRNVSAWAFFTATVTLMVATLLSVTEGSIPASSELTLDALTAVAYVAAGAAGVHPSLRELLRPVGELDARMSYGRLVVLALALIALPLTMLSVWHNDTRDFPVVMLSSALCVGLIIWRLALLLTEREHSWRELQRRAKRESALAKISTGAVEAWSIDELLHRSSTILRDAMAPHTIDIHLTDPTLLPTPLTPSSPIEHTDATTVVALNLPTTLDPHEREFLTSAHNLIANAILRRAAEEKTRHQALHDMLTGLPNRLLFLDRLAHTLARDHRNNTTCTVFFIDLDGFKTINDTYGHAAGDQILMTTADRLTAICRKGDTAARFSGDEFVLLCDNTTAAEATRIGHRLIELLGQPVPLPPQETEGTASTIARVGASIGVAKAHPNDNPELILHRADAAMYEAKNSGKGRVVTAAATRTGDAEVVLNNAPHTLTTGN